MPQHGGLAASVTVTIDLDALRDQIGKAILSTGDEMSASQARRFACNASLVPMVLDGKSKILDLGMGKRLYDPYQRIALARRDQGWGYLPGRSPRGNVGKDATGHRPGAKPNI